MAKHGKEAVEGAVKLGILTGRFTDAEAEILTSALSSGRPYMISQLDIRGNDLISLGIRGEGIGEALEALLYAAISGEVDNERGALVEYIKNK